MKFRWTVLLICGLALVGCAPQAGQAPMPSPTLPPAATPLPSPTAAPTAASSPTAEPDAAGALPAAVQRAAPFLAEALGVPEGDVLVTGYEEVEWPNSCLGVEEPGMVCAQVITPGYRVTLEAGGKTYTVHMDQGGRSLRQAAPAASAEPILRWTLAGETCRTLAVEAPGRASVTPCGSPLLGRGTPLDQQRQQEFDQLLLTYGSFTASTPTSDLQFTGRGDREPDEAERRSIEAWARLLAQEVEAGRTSAAAGLALSWQRSGGIAGFCDSVSIYQTGFAVVTSCKTGEEIVRLTPAQLAQLYDWTDRLAPFELTQSDPAVADAMTVSLTFAGLGQAAPSQAEKDSISGFAAAVQQAGGQPGGPQSAELRQAEDALVEFFSLLSQRQYRPAAALLGADLATLQGYNPDVAADDAPALLERACTANGFQCLPVLRIVSREEASDSLFRFVVEFANPDGTLFQRGPCCGATETEQPPESQFPFTVVRAADGSYKVMDLPVYVP